MTPGIDSANKEFWDEICGSTLAEYLGIKDHSESSLQLFDKGFLEMYPYLLPLIKPNRMAGKKVLEIGLGYGTVGQKLAEAGAHYSGLDIAAGPVKMMNYRMEMKNLNGKAVQGSMLECPFESESFDFVVSIGCFHHTGDVKRCLDETYRVLKPGGVAVIMVYNQFSYRQWTKWPKQTFKILMQDLGFKKEKVEILDEQKWHYDYNLAGKNAPETVFVSIKQAKKMLKPFSKVKYYKENCTDVNFLNKVFQSIHYRENAKTEEIEKSNVMYYYAFRFGMKRVALLSTLGKLFGLDLYIVAQK